MAEKQYPALSFSYSRSTRPLAFARYAKRALAVALAGSLLWTVGLGADAAVPVVTNLAGTVTVKTAHGASHDLSLSEPLQYGDGIVTASNSQAILNLAGVGKVRLAPATSVIAFAAPDGLQVKLQGGALCVMAQAQKITVATDRAVLTSQEPTTIFDIAATPAGTSVAVYRGNVLASREGAAFGTVAAGEALFAGRDNRFRRVAIKATDAQFASLRCPGPTVLADQKVEQPPIATSPAGPPAGAAQPSGGNHGLGGFIGALLGIAGVVLAVGHRGGGASSTPGSTPTPQPSLLPSALPSVLPRPSPSLTPSPSPSPSPSASSSPGPLPSLLATVRT